jgi:hypothetical protein
MRRYIEHQAHVSSDSPHAAARPRVSIDQLAQLPDTDVADRVVVFRHDAVNLMPCAAAKGALQIVPDSV